MHLEVIIISLFEKEITRKDSYKLREIKEGDIIPIVSDVMFHTMLNNSKRKKYVSYLLSLVLDEDYEEILNSIEFVRDELDRDNYYESRRTVDLVCKIKDKILNIEMNNNSGIESLERNISYLNDLYKSNMKKGSGYNYNYCIQININNFNFKGNKKIIERFKLRDEEGVILTDKINYIYIYLPLIKNKCYTKSELNELEKLLLAFNEENSEELNTIIGGNKIMEEYRRDAIDASCDSDIIGLYDKEKTREMLQTMQMQRERAEGIQEGIQEGIEKERISLIKNMIKKGLNDDTICEYLEISLKELDEYKSKL